MNIFSIASLSHRKDDRIISFLYMYILLNQNSQILRPYDRTWNLKCSARRSLFGKAFGMSCWFADCLSTHYESLNIHTMTSLFLNMYSDIIYLLIKIRQCYIPLTQNENHVEGASIQEYVFLTKLRIFLERTLKRKNVIITKS